MKFLKTIRTIKILLILLILTNIALCVVVAWAQFRKPDAAEQIGK